MDVLAMYFRLRNLESDLFKDAFNKHCEEDKREETWKYLLGQAGFHSVALTYKKALSMGIKVNRIPDKLIVPITKIVRDAEKDFGELTTSSPLKDFLTVSDDEEKKNDIVSDLDKKFTDDEKMKKIVSNSDKKSSEDSSMSIPHAKIRAFIENSYMGFVGYDIFSVVTSVSKGKKSFNLIWLESGWREEVVPAAVVELEKAEKYNFVINAIIGETLAGLDKTWDDASEEEIKVIKDDIEKQIGDQLRAEFDASGGAFDLLASSEKKIAIIDAAVEMYETYRLKDEVHDIVLAMAEEQLLEDATEADIQKRAVELWNELNGEFCASIADTWEEYEEMEEYDQVKMFKEFVLAKTKTE